MKSRIEEHYSHPNLLSGIQDFFSRAGRPVNSITLDDLAGADEFHIGGRAATEMILNRHSIGPESRLLDIGCGLGGAARFAANRFGCHVDGFDLTSDFIETGRELNKWVGLSKKIRLAISTVEHLPAEKNSYDLAYMFHVGMNVEDKQSLFSQVAEALKPDGIFVVYDVMKEPDTSNKNQIPFPVPWASEASLDFSCTKNEYLRLLEKVGFDLIQEIDHKEFGLDFFQKMLQKKDEPTPKQSALPTLRQIVRVDFEAKMKNVVKSLNQSITRPIELIVRKRAK